MRKFTVKGIEVEAEQIEVPKGRAAFDLETGRTVMGPAKVWQQVKGKKGGGGLLITDQERRALVGEGDEGDEKPKRGRPPGKSSSKGEAPPDL